MLSIFTNKVEKKKNNVQSLFVNSLKGSYISKPNIFLDLDNTIINALSKDELDSCYKAGFNPEKSFPYYDFKINGVMLYRIFERPGLQKFLDYLFSTFNVSVFTAADNDYASFIVDNIINLKGRKISYFFYGYHAEITAKNMRGLKDLDLLWNVYKVSNLDPCNTIILDDNKEVYNTNRENCVRVPAFSIFDEDDKVPNPKSTTDNYLLTECIQTLNKKLLDYQEKGCIIPLLDNKSITNEFYSNKFIYLDEYN